MVSHALHTAEPLWKGQECLIKVAKFGPFPCTILYKSCLFYPSWQATSFERPPFWMAFVEGFHCMYTQCSLRNQWCKGGSINWKGIVLDVKGTLGIHLLNHDDVIKWKHFPRYWLFVREIQRPAVNYPHKGQWREAMMFSLISTLNKRLSKPS